MKMFDLGDIVELKKSHPCGSVSWKIIRMGMDIRIKCTGCERSILLPRDQFKKKIKKVITKKEEY